ANVYAPAVSAFLAFVTASPFTNQVAGPSSRSRTRASIGLSLPVDTALCSMSIVVDTAQGSMSRCGHDGIATEAADDDLARHPRAARAEPVADLRAGRAGAAQPRMVLAARRAQALRRTEAPRRRRARDCHCAAHGPSAAHRVRHHRGGPTRTAHVVERARR